MVKVFPKINLRILKRFCSFALAVILCVPMCVLPLPVHAAKSITLPDTLTPEMAAAFANQLSETESSYGGTLYAVIETLGPDKFPVLRVIEDMEIASEESIWLFSNGKLENVYWDMDQGGSGDSGDFFVSIVDGINYYVSCHYARDYESYYQSFEIYTIESNRWIPKIKFRESQVSDIDSDTGELINTITSYFATENDSEKSISEAEYNQYVAQYTGTSNGNNLLTAQDLLSALHSFGETGDGLAQDITESTNDGTFSDMQDVLSSLNEETLREMEIMIGLLCKKDHSFETVTADNQDLFNLAELFMMLSMMPIESEDYVGLSNPALIRIIPPEEYGFSYDENEAIRRVASCEEINQTIHRLTGRTIDFTNYESGQMPTSDKIWNDIWNSDGEHYIVGGKWYYYCTPGDLPLLYAEIQNLYNVGDNIFLLNSELTFGDEDGVWYNDALGSQVSAIFEKAGDDYRLLKIYPINATPSIEEVKQYAIKVNPEPNFKIDYSVVSQYTDLSQYVEALKNALVPADQLNDAGNRAITDYVDFVTQNYAPAAVYANENSIVISPETVKAAQTSASEAKGTLMDAIGGLTLSRTPTLTARIDVSGLDLTSPVRVRLPEDTVAAASDLDALTLVLSDNQHMITIPADGLRQIGYLDVQLEQAGQDQYSISFFDQSDNVIERLETNVTFTLPASSELSSVQAVCAGYSDNWGGQYDSQNKTITFQTPYTGEYTILTNTIEIPDIDYLSDEMQRAITFMVSKGYFELDSEGRFNPSVGLNRYEFTQALVKIFFALNRDAVTSFPDVTADNPYYPFVASGEENEILSGYDDGLFHGDNDILRVQMLAICGRTLVNKKGYSRPEDPSVYLNYVDSASIPEWSVGDLALTVREGLIESGSALRPNQPINRREAALILYRLFMLLYEVSPTPITIVEAQPVEISPEIASSGSISPAVIGGVVAVGIGAAGGVAYFFLGKRKGISRKS